MPTAKKPDKKPAAPKWEDGQRVSIEVNGETVFGKITEITKKSIEVTTDDDIAYECQPDELTDAPDGGGDTGGGDETPKKGAKGTRSLGAAFNAVPKAEGTGGGGLPIGTHEALVTGHDGAVTDKGASVYLEVTGVNDAEIDGKTQRKYYQIVGEDGELQEQGCGILKSDLVLLGLEEDDIDVPDTADPEELIAGLKKILKKVVKEGPWVSVNVKEGKKGYTNMYFQGLMEDQANKPDKPD